MHTMKQPPLGAVQSSFHVHLCLSLFVKDVLVLIATYYTIDCI